MDEKWHQHDIMVVVGSCLIVEKELWQSCNWIAMSYIKVWLYIWWVTFLATHATCPIAFIQCRKYNELQMVITTQKVSCKHNCKTPIFLIMHESQLGSQMVKDT
jgi:hypothetical protein